MSEGSPEGGGGDSGGVLQDGQFGDTAQNPGDGVFSPGWYGGKIASNPRYAAHKPHKRKKRRKKR